MPAKVAHVLNHLQLKKLYRERSSLEKLEILKNGRLVLSLANFQVPGRTQKLIPLVEVSVSNSDKFK